MPTLSRRLLWPLAILLLVLGRPLAAADLYYLGQRIPDIQKPWDSHDYQVLIDALKKLEETQKNALPRRSGEFTGPLYLRMVSEENFRPQLNIYSPLEIRQNEAREVLFKLKELMRLYFDFRAAKQPYGAEALGLMSYSLREQSILFTLTVEFWMTLSQAEQRNPARLQGMQETKAAAAMLTGSASTTSASPPSSSARTWCSTPPNWPRKCPSCSSTCPPRCAPSCWNASPISPRTTLTPRSAATCATCNRCCRRSRPTWKSSWRPGGTPRHRPKPWT